MLGGPSTPRHAPATLEGLLGGAPLPCWAELLALNPALEDQAIGRAWRMGQRRAVKVLRFYVAGSVEERIMEVGKARTSATATWKKRSSAPI